MREKRPASKFFGTAVLALSLLGLQGSLWYFRPQLAGRASPLNHKSAASSHGSNRKLLQFNASVDSEQRLSTKNRELEPAQVRECSELWNLNSSEERCQFVKATDSCEIDEGFIQYIQIPYCSFPSLVSLAFVLLALWLMFLFITLGLTADEYFCSSLTVISKTLGMSQNIAGVTFMAHAVAAPDIFSTLAAFSQTKGQNETQLGVQGIFGAGMFVTTVIIAVISFISPVTLATRPFIRDMLFTLGAVAWTFLILYKEHITLGESIGFIVYYVAYILLVVVGHYIYQRWKRNSQAVETFLESEIKDAARGGNKAAASITVLEESNNFDKESINTDEPHTLPNALFRTENTLLTPAIHSVPKPESKRNSTSSDEEVPLLGGRPKISAWRKFLQGLEPIDRDEWSQSNLLWKFFIICKVPAVFLLNLTIPVVDYNKGDHNWNKWLNVLHCITMPVFCVVATKGSNILIGGQIPAWALALFAGLVLARFVAMATTSDRPPCGHFLFAYMAFVVSVIWIYTTANEIVNLLQTFGIMFGLSDAILGLTFLAWGNSIGDFVSSVAVARQGFSRMAISGSFAGVLLDILLGIGIPCTLLTVSRGHAIPLPHRSHQYEISAGFLVASLSSSAIVIPLMGFKIPRIYGVYLILLYIAYLATSIAAEIKRV